MGTLVGPRPAVYAFETPTCVLLILSREAWSQFLRSGKRSPPRCLPAAANMDGSGLQLHRADPARRCEGLADVPNQKAQREKSLGRGPRLTDGTETAVQTHAFLRARAGFNINQLAAEYRGLRATVLRLWRDDCAPEAPDLDDVIRFNEAIDQALAESVTFLSTQAEQNRNLLLGMLGHTCAIPSRPSRRLRRIWPRSMLGASIRSHHASETKRCPDAGVV